MTIVESIILGLIQGLTEFLPVSSSGHLLIAKELFGIESENLTLEVLLHAATVLSTIVVFRKELLTLLKGFFKFELNSETQYLFKIALSMVPIMIVGLLFKKEVEALFGEGLVVVGVALLITALLLFLTTKIRARESNLGYKNAFWIGVAQTIAVVPGLSRSGATISTGLLLGVKKEEVAKFSFLMVLVPILGESFLELISGELSQSSSGIGYIELLAGFLAAFISGLFACKVMIALVKRSKLSLFALYCAVVGLITLIYPLI